MEPSHRRRENRGPEQSAYDYAVQARRVRVQPKEP